MPKSFKKSCITQASISRYFVGGNSRNSNSTKERSAEQLSRSKQKHSSDGDEFGLPSKRAKLSLQDHHGRVYQTIEETSTSTSTVKQGTGSLCPSTLEKLKGFACLASESSVGHRDTERGRKALDNAQLIVRDQKPCDDTEHLEENKLGELKGENEEEEGRSWLTDSEQGFKSGRKDAHDDESNLLPSTVAKSRRSKNMHASRVYTPLEQQVIQLKEQHKDALLAVECGYKYRFFGEDAEIAAKVLNIFCHLDHNFMTCSIPTHRLFVHVRRLVSHGHKVGVVKQTETSAIKASGTSRNTLFTRQLSGLYTKSTLVGEDVNPVCRLGDVEEGSSSDAVLDPPESFLLCVSETWDKLRKQLTVGLVAVQPSTGDVLFDCFPDGPSRSELEGRVVKINPVEILLPSDASEETHRLVQSIANASNSSLDKASRILENCIAEREGMQKQKADDRVRVEKRDRGQFEFVSAMNTVTEFYCHSQEKGCRSLSSVASLESPVICCLGPLIQYLREFNLERVLRSESSFQRLSRASEGMRLNAATLRNLEILNNQTDGGVKGSLLWVLDHTRTHFGRRLLRRWVGQPLTDSQSVSQRLDAVQEILESNSITLNPVRSLLSHLPDLDRGICSIYHRKSSTQEFYVICSCLARLSLELQALVPAIQSQVRSSLLTGLLLDTPNLLAPAQSFLKVLNEKAAKSGDKTELFSDLAAFPVLQERKEQIQDVISEIYNHRKEIRRTLKVPAFDYTTVSGQEFLIEVKNSLLSTVPPEWVKVSSTKAVSRYHTPFLTERYKKLLQLREQLLLDCQTEWIHFLDQFGEHYHLMKRAISHLATLDCLFSLAEVAKQGDYCRPEVSKNRHQIVIRDGRHPAIDLLMGEKNQYVPNVTELQGDGKRTMIITGPNMGGKSSYIRQVALICLMAQMGSYVPASQAHLGILDGIYVRMGASDNIFQRRSTFMEELSEASEIISRATEHSLVILDELGRGTSTHDGIAIAYATLEYFIRDVKALTLFVTHYPPLCELEHVYPEHVSNYHMAFLLNEPDIAADTDDGEVTPEFITFLYQLTEGAAGRSYGLNVARLADIPDSILHTAAGKARELESTIDARRKRKKLLSDLWRVSDQSSLLEWLQSNP